MAAIADDGFRSLTLHVTFGFHPATSAIRLDARDGVISGCRCGFGRCPRSHRQQTYSRCSVRPLGAINRDAGADFEQTINDEFHEPADAFVSGSISACTVNGIVGKRDVSSVHRSPQISPSGASAVTTRRECVAQCWPPVPPRGRCECLMEVFVSPPCFSTDQ